MHAANYALQAGRSLQKKQTGFLHIDERIPIYENALFALALFRSRLSDHVLEGKALIEKLLHFEKEGNFPVHLHEWPDQHDPYLGLRLLPIFFWIRSDFALVIGDLKKKLEASIDRMIVRAEKLDLPAWGKFRLQAMKGEVGELPKTLFDWGEGLISLQIAEKKGAEITSALEEACALWHPELSLYVGPAMRRDQEGFFPLLTLFDLFMCEWQKSNPERAKEIRPIHLRGALIRPQDVSFSSKPVPFVHSQTDAECPLYIAWGNHTFVLAKKVREDEFAANFYLNYHSDHEIFVNGKKATSFQQGDELEIRSKEQTLRLSFSAENGVYFGHLLRGNRPSQHACHGEMQFSAYDWRIAIRSVKSGKDPILLRVLLEPILLNHSDSFFVS